MKILFLGDVVGRAGRKAVFELLPGIREQNDLDFVVVNGENAAGGFGITEAIHQQFLDAGADVVTTGNHVWDQREALSFIDRVDTLLRPLNYPEGTPGKGANVFQAKNGAKVMVLNVMGRVFMEALEDPFIAVGRELANNSLGDSVDAVILDIHAEATSEKQAMAHYVDGRVSLVVGTHTHTPTADHQILSNGTGFQSDVGMCGDFDSIIGMDKEEPLQRFLKKISTKKYAPAMGEVTICGLAVTIDDESGLCTEIEPFRTGGRLSSATPSFWSGK